MHFTFWNGNFKTVKNFTRFIFVEMFDDFLRIIFTHLKHNSHLLIWHMTAQIPTVLYFKSCLCIKFKKISS